MGIGGIGGGGGRKLVAVCIENFVKVGSCGMNLLEEFILLYKSNVDLCITL